MPAGRPLQFDPETALAEATAVFWVKGYESTSLQDLLEATGLSKSSLYQAFGSKHSLFERCLGYYRDTTSSLIAARLAASTSGLRFLQELLMEVAAEAGVKGPRRGCLMINTATEFAGRDRQVAKEVSRGTRRMLEIFEAAIHRAQRDGEISATEDASSLARFVMTTISGVRAMVKVGMPRKSLEQMVHLALKALR
jgi:TetR/AcrR family transcriptional repressor of nem operon